MVQPSIGLDTPRTNLGDATYLANHTLDFDISQEQSFQSPSRDNNNLVTQLKNARRGNTDLRTPRSRAALSDRRNLPAGLGGGEFTPLLKSATRNSALRLGKENATPALAKLRGLQDIPEDLSPLPQMGSSIYGRDSRNGSYISGTPAPHLDSSSTASTPMALLPRRTEGHGALQDGNQLSLREQENVIDKIEKENFGLKLKIHFLEEALRKAGPGFGEAALKENTELKVDKVTMQKELHRYRKTLAAAEKDVETFRQHMLEMQEKMKRKQFDAGQLEELDRLRRSLEEKETEVGQLKGQEQRYDDLEDKIHDLETDLREKERLLDDQDDRVDDMKTKLEKQTSVIVELEQDLKKAQRRAIELEEEAQASEELAEAKEIIDELERDLERSKREAEDAKEERQEAVRDKERAEADLDELQDEMANKSITTKGLSRQIEEKANRLQDEVEDLREKHLTLEDALADKSREVKKLLDKIDDLKRDGEVREQKLLDKLEISESEKQGAVREHASLAAKFDALQKDTQQTEDEKNLLQIRHDALTSESAGLQRDVSRSHAVIEELQDKLEHEKTLALSNEREVRDQYKAEIDRLSDRVEDLESEIREKERLYEADGDKWDSQRRKLESQKQQAEHEAAGLRRTVDKLQETEGALSGKESKLQQALHSEQQRHEKQEALLTHQIKELNQDVQSRSEALDEVRAELSNVREELRLSQREQKTLAETIEGLEDEVEILQASLDDETDRSNEEISSARREVESLQRQVQVLKLDLSKAESASADARAEVEAFHGDLRAGEGNNSLLSSRLRDVETQLSKILEEKRQLKDQLASATMETNALRRSKSDVELERDELQSQLDAMKQQEDATFRLDQERVDLRASKLKLDNELRRLREETKLAVLSQQTLEKELEEELERASAEEARLNTEIQDLQRILRGSSEKRELASARKVIQQLEARIQELNQQIVSSDDHTDVTNELSIMRRDLSTARQKEMEYLQREASQKDTLRALKRQVIDLERKAHAADISRIAAASPSPSPRSSVGDSARKSELIETRNRLSTTQETVRDLRAQLKDSLKDSARKLKAVETELRERSESWESEKDQLERSLDDALLKTEEIVSQSKISEATIARLRAKTDRLEKALQAERLNHGGDRTIANERHDLHEMLRESQVQVETLQVVIKERDNTIRTINKSYARLNEYAAKVQDQRNKLRTKDASSNEQLEILRRKIKESTEAWEAEKQSLVQQKQDFLLREREFNDARSNWDVEKLTLTRGVRFANMSISDNGGDLEFVTEAFAEREEMYIKLQRGLKMQVDWWRAKCEREAMFRDMGIFAKQYMGAQIEMHNAYNKATIAKLKTIPGVKAAHIVHQKPPITIRKVAHMFRAIFRMKLGVKEWAKHLVIKHALMEKIEQQKQQKLIDNATTEPQSRGTGCVGEAAADGPQLKKAKSTSRKGSEAQPKATSKKMEYSQSLANEELLAEATNYLSKVQAKGITKNSQAIETRTSDGWMVDSDAHLTERSTHPADETTTELTMGNPAPGEILERMKRRMAASNSAEKGTKDQVTKVQGSQHPNQSSESNLQIRIEIRLPKSEREAEAGGKREKRDIMLTYDPASYRGGIDHIVTEDPEVVAEQHAVKTGQPAPKPKFSISRINRKPSVVSEFDVSRPIEQTAISDTDNTDQSLIIAKAVKRKSSKRRSSSATATQSDLARMIASRKAAEAGYDTRGSPPKRSASRRVADATRE